MEFYDFLTTYDHAHRHGLPADVTPRRFYREAAATTAMLALGGVEQCRCEHNRAVCEWDWHELGRPHYKVHPGVLPLLMDVSVDIPVEYLKLPFTTFLLRLPKQDNPLVINASLRVESILVSCQTIRDTDDRRFYLWIATGEIDQSGFPVLTYSQLACTPGTSIEEAFHALPRQPMDLTDEQTEQCLRLAVSICFLATGSDKLLSPDVLSKDLARWLEAMRHGDTGTMRAIEERAVRRGKLGWHVGAGERLLPAMRSAGAHGDGASGHELHFQHQRAAHFRLLPSGRVTFIRQATVRADLPPPPYAVR